MGAGIEFESDVRKDWATPNIGKNDLVARVDARRAEYDGEESKYDDRRELQFSDPEDVTVIYRDERGPRHKGGNSS